jgi:mRNA interferase MazF
MTRGELWWADLGIPFGSEPGYERPVLIIQNDFFNRSKINTTIIVPLTTNILWADPGNVFLSKEDSKLNKDSVISTSQIEVIDRQRLIKKITKIDITIIENIENNLMLVLGIYKI